MDDLKAHFQLIHIAPGQDVLIGSGFGAEFHGEQSPQVNLFCRYAPIAGASGFTSGPKYRSVTSGSVSLVFSKVTPAFAPASEQKYSSSVSSWKRISFGLFNGWPLIVPLPCTQMRP